MVVAIAHQTGWGNLPVCAHFFPHFYSLEISMNPVLEDETKAAFEEHLRDSYSQEGTPESFLDLWFKFNSLPIEKKLLYTAWWVIKRDDLFAKIQNSIENEESEEKINVQEDELRNYSEFLEWLDDPLKIPTFSSEFVTLASKVMEVLVSDTRLCIPKFPEV